MDFFSGSSSGQSDSLWNFPTPNHLQSQNSAADEHSPIVVTLNNGGSSYDIVPSETSGDRLPKSGDVNPNIKRTSSLHLDSFQNSDVAMDNALLTDTKKQSLIFEPLVNVDAQSSIVKKQHNISDTQRGNITTDANKAGLQFHGDNESSTTAGITEPINSQGGIIHISRFSAM